jgi:hypothetical protein
MIRQRALIFSYSDCLHYFAGTTAEPEGSNQCATLLKNPDGKLQKFPSLYRAKLALQQLGYTKAWLVMQSPYDEMIGKEAARNCEMPLLLGEQTFDNDNFVKQRLGEDRVGEEGFGKERFGKEKLDEEEIR